MKINNTIRVIIIFIALAAAPAAFCQDNKPVQVTAAGGNPLPVVVTNPSTNPMTVVVSGHRWDYMMMPLPSATELTAKGQQGWELVAVTGSGHLIFKKPSGPQ
jgi:hypothetical protein